MPRKKAKPVVPKSTIKEVTGCHDDMQMNRFVNFMMDTLQKSKATILQDLDDEANENGDVSTMYVTTKDMIETYDPWKDIVVVDDFFYIPINDTGEYDFGIGIQFGNYVERSDGTFEEGTFSVFGVARKHGDMRKVELKEQCRTGGKSGVFGGLFAISNIISLKLSLKNPLGGGSILYQIIPHSVQAIHEALDQLDIHDDLVDRCFAGICIKDLETTIEHVDENDNNLEFDNYAIGAILFNLLNMSINEEEYQDVFNLILRSDFEPRFQIIKDIPGFRHAFVGDHEDNFEESIDLILRLVKSHRFERTDPSFQINVRSVARIFAAISSTGSTRPMDNSLHDDFWRFIKLLYPDTTGEPVLELAMLDVPSIFKVFARDMALAHDAFVVMRENLRQALNVATSNNIWGIFQEDQIHSILHRILRLPLSPVDMQSLLALLFDTKNQSLYDARRNLIGFELRGFGRTDKYSFASFMQENMFDFGVSASALLKHEGQSFDFKGYLNHVSRIISELKDAMESGHGQECLVTDLDAACHDCGHEVEVTTLINLSLQELLKEVAPRCKGSMLVEYQLRILANARDHLRNLPWGTIRPTLSQIASITDRYRIFMPVTHAETLLLLVQRIVNSLLHSALEPSHARELIELLWDEKLLHAFIFLACTARQTKDWSKAQNDTIALFALLLGSYQGERPLPHADVIKEFLAGLLIALGNSREKEAFFDFLIDQSRQFRAVIDASRDVYPVMPLFLGINMAMNCAGLDKEQTHEPMKALLLDIMDDIVNEIKNDEKRIASIRDYIFRNRRLYLLAYQDPFPIYDDYFGRDMDLYALFSTFKNLLAFRLDTQDIIRMFNNLGTSGLLDNESFVQIVGRGEMYYILEIYTSRNKVSDKPITKIFQILVQLKKIAGKNIPMLHDESLISAIVKLGAIPDKDQIDLAVTVPVIRSELKLILSAIDGDLDNTWLDALEGIPGVYSSFFDTPDLFIEFLVTTKLAISRDTALKFSDLLSFLDKWRNTYHNDDASRTSPPERLADLVKVINQLLTIDPALPFTFTPLDYTSIEHDYSYNEPVALVPALIDFLGLVDGIQSWQDWIRLYMYKELSHCIVKNQASKLEDVITMLEAHPLLNKDLKLAVAICLCSKISFYGIFGEIDRHFWKTLSLKKFIVHPEDCMKDLKVQLDREIKEATRKMSDPTEYIGHDDPAMKRKMYIYLEKYLFGNTRDPE